MMVEDERTKDCGLLILTNNLNSASIVALTLIETTSKVVEATRQDAAGMAEEMSEPVDDVHCCPFANMPPVRDTELVA